MNQGIRAFRGGIGMSPQIGFTIEERVRAHASCTALFQKVEQRIRVATGWRVAAKIVIGVEQRMGLAAFDCAVPKIVTEGIHAGGGQVGIFFQVERTIKQTGALKQAEVF